MEFFIEYGMFLAKVATLVVAIAVVIGIIASSGSRGKKSGKKGSIRVTQVNDHLEEMRDSLRVGVLEPEELKLLDKAEKKTHKAELKARKALLKKAAKNSTLESSEEASEDRKKRVYVLGFKGNVSADAVESLREEITAILSLATPQDEVILNLESPGGMVHAYGLASSQLLRIKNQKIPLTICVDRVAASGGYMMACLADRL
ncbi:MAG: serine protease SohB, partial [Pseudohongiellaceae bacterium]